MNVRLCIAHLFGCDPKHAVAGKTQFQIDTHGEKKISTLPWRAPATFVEPFLMAKRG